MPAETLKSVDDLTTDWLAVALGQSVRGFTLKPVGTGQSASTYRITLDWDGPTESVILKLADSDPAVRRTGVMTGQYRREASFYNKVAHRLPGTALTHCHFSSYDEETGHFTILLEDVAPARQGDQIVGCTPEQAAAAVKELARLVAPVVEDPDLASWLDTPPKINSTMLAMLLPSYFERYNDQITDEQRSLIEGFAARVDTWTADRVEPRSLVHGDYRLDNLLIADGDEMELTVVDWQTLAWGPITSDLAYFIGGNLTPDDRRKHERHLVKIFHKELLKQGVRNFSFKQCWRGYAWGAFSGLQMAIAAPMVVTQTERGDEMFLTMLSRHAEQIVDLKAMELLEKAHRTVLTVDPNNEARHEPGDERHWNESFYLDAMSADGKHGAYVRMGYVPNLGHTVYTAWIVADGRPSVAVLDYAAPLPASGLTVEADRFNSTLDIEEPLQRVRVTLRGTGESYDDPAAALRGKPGTPVDVELDLVWETDGDPYMYPITTRYEMPCKVSGTVIVDGEVRPLVGPGQRDHSWGDRNWWSMDWTWASAHLDGATRIQVIEARIPGLPIAAAGYEQRGSHLIETKLMNAAYDIPPNRMPGRTTATLEPSGTQLTWEPIAYGPLRLEAPSGEVCEFPRAMARVTTSDGRTGLGWIEWGHNVDAPARGYVGEKLRATRTATRAKARKLLAKVPDKTVVSVMESRAGSSLAAAVFWALPRTLDAENAQAVDARVRFNIQNATGSRTDRYDLVLSVGETPMIERPGPDAAEPNLSMTLSASDFILLGTGRLDPVAAALERRIALEGDLMFMTTLAPMLAGRAFPQQRPQNV